MLESNAKTFNEFFGEGGWTIKAEGTEKVLSQYQVKEIVDMGYPDKKKFAVVIDHEYIRINATYVKKDKKYKIVHHQIAKNLGKCRY